MGAWSAPADLAPSKPTTAIVRRGDDMDKLVARYGLSYEDLIEANPHKDHHIEEGKPVFDVLIEGEILDLPHNPQPA